MIASVCSPTLLSSGTLFTIFHLWVLLSSSPVVIHVCSFSFSFPFRIFPVASFVFPVFFICFCSSRMLIYAPSVPCYQQYFLRDAINTAGNRIQSNFSFVRVWINESSVGKIGGNAPAAGRGQRWVRERHFPACCTQVFVLMKCP